MTTDINKTQTKVLKSIASFTRADVCEYDKRTVNALTKRGYVRVGKNWVAATAKGRKYIN